MSKVYFMDAQAKPGRPLPAKVSRLLQAAGLADMVAPRDRVAVKVHWGELGNPNYLRPIYCRQAVEAVSKAGGRPFVTDTNVLYRAARHDALGNLEAAACNGFTRETLGAPIIVADGLTGRDAVNVPVPVGQRVRSARIASAIYWADAMVVLSHMKGHMLFGFGGALKNLGMGCATPAGKAELHQELRPQVDRDRCVGCRLCGRVCPEEAISFVSAPGSAEPASGNTGMAVGDGGATLGASSEAVPAPRVLAVIDETRCIGCGECVAACPEEAIPIQWETAHAPLLEKTAEYAWAAVANKPGKVIYVSFLLDVVPDCDCCDWTAPPFVPNLGILASTDPVAIDQAAADLVNAAPLVPGSSVATMPARGEDTLASLHGIGWRGLLVHAEALGLGTTSYELVGLDRRDDR